MKFIDIAKINIKSGDGGPGHISFRREKSVPKGGPDGGNGGKGGDVIFKIDPHLNTLLDFKYKRHFEADKGKPGEKACRTGRNGENLIIRVPNGTIIKLAESDEIIADLTDENPEILLAPGGKGGRGNAEFATPTNQTPRRADTGIPGIEMEIVLELKLLADVGIVGFPNVGKSTLISVISAAKPKIADYPFTTLIPNLGIVKVAERKSFTIADIPGLIEGAAEGKGLGIQFLRHIERTSVLLFLIDSLSLDPISDYNVLINELKKYNPDIIKKKRIICFSRIDAITSDQIDDLKKVKFKGKVNKPMMISAVAGMGVSELVAELWKAIESIKST